MENLQDFIEPERLARAPKSYDNKEFLHSKDGRIVRLLTEYLYPEQYFNEHNINKTIVFYGSARTISTADYKKKMAALEEQKANLSGADLNEVNENIQRLERLKSMCRFYDEGVELAEMLGKWSLSLPEASRFFICTGGGPGMMEAANKGAYKAGLPNIGLNISLPFEQEPNRYITPELNFEFHYFFMRKFWFVFHTKAIVAMPGGLGTLDELMELLTLKQTKKVTKPMPIVLYNEEFWKKLVNFEYLVETGMMNQSDLDLFVYVNSPQEAFDYLTSSLKSIHKL